MLSLLLALVAWVAFVSDFGFEERIISVPVVIQDVPANLRVTRLEPQQVSVVFKAPRQSFDMLDTGSIGVTLSAFRAAAGEGMLRIEPADVLFPDGLELVDVDPDVVWLELIEASDPP